MKSLRLLALLLVPVLALGQLSRMGHLSNRHHIPSDGLEFFITNGCDRGLNSDCNWWDRATQLLTHSADLTGWTVSGSPIVTAKTVEDDSVGIYEYVYQTVAAPDATTHTWTLWILKDAVVPATRFPVFTVTVGDWCQVRLDTASGATTYRDGIDLSHSVTSESIGGNDYWKVAITFTTDDGNGILVEAFPARGASADLIGTTAAAVGTITILRQSLTPGTSSGEYEATGARQSVYNWALTDRRNLLEYSGDLTNGVWTNDGCVLAATTAEDDNAGARESVYQTVGAPDATTHIWTIRVLQDAVVPATRFPNFTVIAASTYNVRLDTSSGATMEAAGLGGFHTVTADGDYWRLEITFTSDDANGLELRIYPAFGANADLDTTSNAAVGTITIASQQLELGSTSTHYQLKDASNYAWLDARVGSAAGSDTNDPWHALWRKNVLADGSTEDLENAVWTLDGAATVDDGDTITFATAATSGVQQLYGTTAGVSFTISATVWVDSGSEQMRLSAWDSVTGFQHGSDETLTTTPIRISASFTAGHANFYARLNNASDAQARTIHATNMQFEVGPLTDYNADDRMIVAARGSYTTDDYLQVARTSSMEPADSVTLFALFKTSDTGNGKALIAKDQGGTRSYKLQLNAVDKLTLLVDGPSDTAISGNTSVTDDKWHLGMAVYDGAFLYIYLDGVSDQTPEASTGSINYNADDLYIGQTGNGVNFMEGVIPAVGMYSRALDPAEALRFYKNIKTWWALDKRGKKNLVLQ